MAVVAFFLSPVGRWIGGAILVIGLLLGTYTKGRFDGRASYKAKIERQINEAVSKGENGRADALRELDAGSVPDGWWRD